MTKTLDAIFRPQSIAVVGASRERGGVGREILGNLVKYEFRGSVYPVNPRANTVLSMKCFPSVAAIPDPVDLAIIVVPARIVPQIMEECGRKGVRGAIIISAGFREVGDKGAQLESEVAAIARRHGIRVVGPNCMGAINTEPDVRMNATFAITMPLDGSIGLMSQSGALCGTLLDYAKEAEIGFSKFVSMGNKMDVSANDLLEAWEVDESVKLVLMYIESFGNPRKFTRIARSLSRKKPVVAVKSGRTVAGARAISSHTGSLAEGDVLTDAIFHQCGVLRVESIEDLLDYAKAFTGQPLPSGKRVAVVTNAGGPGIMATDACVSHGLEMAQFEERTRRTLRENLVPAAAIDNPVDLLAEGNARMYETVLDAVLQDRNVDSVIVIFVHPLMTDAEAVNHAIHRACGRHDKPVLGVFMSTREQRRARPGSCTLPLYMFPESAARALAAMYRYGLIRSRPEGKMRRFDVKAERAESVVLKAREQGRRWLSPPEVEAVLSAYGFEMPRTVMCHDAEAAVAAANSIGYPVVLKLVSADVLHKSDAGGVRADIRNDAEVRAAFSQIVEAFTALRASNPALRMEGVLVQEMVRGGKETILGMTTDPSFGPVVMFGLGGIHVEVLKDVAFRVAPVTDVDASEMVRSIKGFPILDGARGERPVDLERLTEHLQRMSQLVLDLPEIREMDINPLVVFEKGRAPKVLDARIAIQ
ncbi:MAG: CoA-binding protein [Euryarchaeota archaeon]|nr:CoA-binding protein [Euryarchaeota archaeon]